jgi:hypothetical protein
VLVTATPVGGVQSGDACTFTPDVLPSVQLAPENRTPTSAPTARISAPKATAARFTG